MADTLINSDFWLPVYQRPDGSLYSAGQPGNTFSDNLMDTVYFGAAPSPGIAEVTVMKERSVDKKKGAGSDGGRLTIHGVNPAEFEIRFRIWTPEQWEAMKQLKALVFVPAYKTTTTTLKPVGFQSTTTVNNASGTATATSGTISIPQAPTKFTKTTPVTFDVTHPTTAFHHIKAVQVIGVGGPDPGASTQDRYVTFRCAEYLPPGTKNATQTDEAPTSNGTQIASNNPTPGTNPANTGP